MAYNPGLIESKWQKFWEEKELFKAENHSPKPKYYILDMFPYPSSSGLHVGHPEGYTATDILARFKRANGFNVLHPMGWDAFGLPAEQYALQTGVHPAITTQKAIDTFRRQLKMLGFSFDWTREVSTCDPTYYRWTQFLFTKLYEKGLAYRTEVPVNWCAALKTVLSNEEVIDGKSERGGHPVTRVPMKQWMLKITDYADRLLSDLDALDWPESTKELQRNWIGKSYGLQILFAAITVSGEKKCIEVFTTRPDTLFGVTFLVLAPEHPWVLELTTPDRKKEVVEYQANASRKSEVSRQEASTLKTGCFLGTHATNPADQRQVPIWISDYVLSGYGTGAIMAVPGHDERDFEFAKTFDLPIKTVMTPESGLDGLGPCFSGDGIATQSGFITGMKTEVAIQAMIEWAEKNNHGKRTVRYKLRDWLFSRQRYWGEPFPIVYGSDEIPQLLRPDELPVLLPEVESYEPTGSGESPLASIREWVETKRGSSQCKRETDTMPGSAGSSWYFLRYCDPLNRDEAFSKAAQAYWMPVDLYLGGPEHAVGHLLYARFWTKVLFDAGLVSHSEPFKKLVHQGMILGEDGEKMSKSRGNVINPDTVIQKYGADTLRMYEMFMGPLEKDKPWSTTAIEGIYRFLQRVWRVFFDDETDRLTVSENQPGPDEIKIIHQTVKKVTEDITNLRFNTAISQMMIFINHMTKLKDRPKVCLRTFIQLLNPFAPHVAEELWERLGEKTYLTFEPWPIFDEALAKEDWVTIAIQVMGKMRGTVEVPLGSNQDVVERMAREISTVKTHLGVGQVKKVVFVKDKILNFVVQ